MHQALSIRRGRGDVVTRFTLPLCNFVNRALALADCLNEFRRLLFDIAPETVGNGTVRRFAPARRDDLDLTSLEMLTGDADQALVAEIPIDQVFRHVAPSHAPDDQLPFHQLVAHRPTAS